MLSIRQNFLQKSSYCADRHAAPDGGDCQALQGRLLRPEWACFSDMRAELPGFLKLYETRPIQNNHGGIMLDHSFALYYTLKHIRPVPKTVIESGAFKGHGTWIIQQALPNARIFSLDPGPPKHRLEGVEYMVGSLWKDLATVDWKAKNVDPNQTVLFIDDHQSGFRRTFLDMKPKGFNRFILEDNYPYPHGDNMSFKWACELERESEWPGVVHDNFGKEHINLTWSEHLQHADYLRKALKVYYEFPPIASSELSGQTRFEPTRTSAPIVTIKKFFQQSGLAELHPRELAGYTHFLYVETIQDKLEAPLAFGSHHAG